MATPTVDRETTTPFLLHLFYKQGAFHRYAQSSFYTILTRPSQPSNLFLLLSLSPKPYDLNTIHITPPFIPSIPTLILRKRTSRLAL